MKDTQSTQSRPNFTGFPYSILPRTNGILKYLKCEQQMKRSPAGKLSAGVERKPGSKSLPAGRFAFCLFPPYFLNPWKTPFVKVSNLALR